MKNSVKAEMSKPSHGGMMIKDMVDMMSKVARLRASGVEKQDDAAASHSHPELRIPVSAPAQANPVSSSEHFSKSYFQSRVVQRKLVVRIDASFSFTQPRKYESTTEFMYTENQCDSMGRPPN